LTRDIETLTEKSQKNLGVIEKEVGRINRLLPDIWRKRTKYNKIPVCPAENKLWVTTIRQGQQGGMKKGGVIRMEKLKPMSKTFTLTRRDSGRLKQSSYQVCKDEKFYYFSSIGGVAFFIAEFIKPRSNDDLITITVESTNLKQEDSCHANEILFWFYTEVGFRMHIYLVLCTF